MPLATLLQFQENIANCQCDVLKSYIIVIQACKTKMHSYEFRYFRQIQLRLQLAIQEGYITVVFVVFNVAL